MGLWTPLPAQAEDLCAHLPSLLEKISEVRGLQPKDPLSCRVVSEKEMRANPYVISVFADVQRTLPYDEKVYKLLGLIPQRYPLRDCISEYGPDLPDVLWNPERKEIMVLANSGTDIASLAYEVTRALLDQHFSVRKQEKESRESSDRELAFLAFLNGSALNTVGLLKLAEEEETDMPSVSPQLVKPQCVPPETLMFLTEFPQQFGVLYADHLRTTGGNELLDKVFSNFPKSTRDILYKKNPLLPPDRPRESVPVPPLPGKLKDGGYTLRFQDVLGEYTVRTLLRDYLSSAPALTSARGWVGDHVALYENKVGDTLLLWDTRWLGPEESKEFFQAIRILLGIRYKADLSRTLDAFVYQAKDGLRFEVTRHKSTVMIDVRKMADDADD